MKGLPRLFYKLAMTGRKGGSMKCMAHNEGVATLCKAKRCLAFVKGVF